MDFDSYIMSSGYVDDEIAKVNQRIVNVTSGIKSITQQNGNQLVFTLNDNTTIALTVTGLSQENYTTVDKNKLALLNSDILSQFTYVNNSLLFNGNTVENNKLDLSNYYTQTQINNLLNNKANFAHNHNILDIINLSNELSNRYTKLETLSTTEINTLVNGISKGMSWKESVDSVVNLPLVDNTDTDTRITKDTLHINIWSTSLNKWIDLGGSDTIPMASEVLDGKMSKEQYSKLESIVISNLATTQQLADGLATKSDITHTHSNYVEKEIGKSLVLDTKITEWDGKTQINDTTTTSTKDTYSIDKIKSLINNGSSFEVVSSLPENNINSNKIYILPDLSLNYYDINWHKLNDNQIVIGTSNTDTSKLWLDTSSITSPLLKWYNGIDWISISGSSTGATINDASTISTTETYSVNKINTLINGINNTNFTNANNAKTMTINAIGDTSLTTSNTFTEISNSLLAKKQNIVTSLSNKGVSANQSDDLDSYATKINSIIQNTQIKNTKLNKTAGSTYQVQLTNPTALQNISTSVLEYQAGTTGVVRYDCAFNNADSTSFNTTTNQHLIFDGMMKQDNKINTITMTNEGTIDTYTVYSALLDKTGFNKINSIAEATVSPNEVLTISGTYNPTLVQANSDISLTGIDRISGIVWTASATNTSKLLLIYSIDSGVTWKGYDSTNHVVLDISNVNDLSEVKSKGISIASLNAFTQTDLDNMRNGSPKIRFAYYIEKNNIADTLQNDEIVLKVDMTGNDIFSTHYTVAFDGNKTITYTFNANNTYTIIYTDNN